MLSVLKRNRNRAVLLLLSFLLLFSVPAFSGIDQLRQIRAAAAAVFTEAAAEASLFRTQLPLSQPSEAVLKAAGPLQTLLVFSREETENMTAAVREHPQQPDGFCSGLPVLFFGSLGASVFSRFIERHKTEYRFRRLTSGRYPPCGQKSI